MAHHLRELVSLEDIVGLAQRQSGAHEVGDQRLLSRVRAAVEWINASGPYTPDQVEAMSRQLQNLLARRLKMMLDRECFPDIAEENIERPIFIVGYPRAGTTLLHSLLAEDPDALALQSWHMYSPSPPPGAGPVVPERIAYAQRQVEAWMDFCPAQKPMHPYIDKGAYQLIEDDEAGAIDFRNTYCYHFYRVPTMDYYVAFEKDEVDNFRWHREFLQYFQWNSGKSRWACKGPTHQGKLKQLFEVYPDALCIWPHRPIGDIFASIISLSTSIFDTVTNRPTDLKANARMHAEAFKPGLDAVMSQELIDDPRVMHVDFRALTADPMQCIRDIYGKLDLPVTDDFATRVGAWLEAPENQVDRYGRYPYSYEALGLDREWVEDLFAGYSKRFGLD
jgi:hypothetical protein